jgi:hypothetical protein
MEKYLNKNVKPLSLNELKKVNGGGAGLFPLVFVAGVAYGYIKEKLDSGKW